MATYRQTITLEVTVTWTETDPGTQPEFDFLGDALSVTLNSDELGFDTEADMERVINPSVVSKVVSDGPIAWVPESEVNNE